MKKFLMLPLLAALLSGCQTPDKEKFSRQIYIDSIPQGAPIVVDGLKLGAAPITIGVETNEDGFFVRKTVITAIPQEESLHTQIITFPAYLAASPDKSAVPEKIVFDMRKGPAEGGGVTME